MKKKKKEVDVDSIGNQKNPMTKEEGRAISEYLKASKSKRIKVLQKIKKESVKSA